MMKTNLRSIRIKGHRTNIERYRKLLTGRLTKVERQYVLRRIAEERAEIKDLEDRANDLSSSPRLALDQNQLSEREMPA